MISVGRASPGQLFFGPSGQTQLEMLARWYQYLLRLENGRPYGVRKHILSIACLICSLIVARQFSEDNHSLNPDHREGTRSGFIDDDFLHFIACHLFKNEKRTNPVNNQV
jgi:hypothetical protein